MDLATLEARVDAVEAAADSQAQALSDLRSRVVELEPPVVPGPDPLPGFGSIVGACGVVASQLHEWSPSISGERIFNLGTTGFDDNAHRSLLTAGAQRILATPNAGGSSVLSEAFAFETLARCEGATLLQTETEIIYDQPGPTTDLLVRIGRSKVGVSVMRAMTIPIGSPLQRDLASERLTRELSNIKRSTQNVALVDAWVKQVLVVMAIDQQHADTIVSVWQGLSRGITLDTIVYMIVTDGNDRNLYTNSP